METGAKFATDSLHIEGTASFLNVAKGHVVVDGSLELVYTTATAQTGDNGVKVEGNVEHAHVNAGTDSASAAAAETLSTSTVKFDYDNNAAQKTDESVWEEVYHHTGVVEGDSKSTVENWGTKTIKDENNNDITVTDFDKFEKEATAGSATQLGYDVSVSDGSYLTLKELETAINNGNTYDDLTVSLLHNVDMNERDYSYVMLGNHEGSGVPTFKGTFDGQNYSITNYEIEGFKYGALFGEITDATIENVFLQGKSTCSTAYTDGLVGVANGNCTIENVTVDMTITSAGTNTGGIVGRVSTDAALTIKNATFKGSITASKEGSVGGIVGWTGSNVNVTLINCVNEGNITNTNSSASGLVGRTTTTGGTITFINCQNKGNVISNDDAGGFTTQISSCGHNIIIKNDSTQPGDTCKNIGNITGKTCAGGIIGCFDRPESSIEINGALNSGEIKGAVVGGIVGSSSCNSSIINCSNTGAISSTGYINMFSDLKGRLSAAGGVVGYLGGTNSVVTNCSGGTNAISAMSDGTPEGTYNSKVETKGRLIGIVQNKTYRSGALLTIDNSNNDDNSIGMVGYIGYGWHSYLTIVSGELYGTPGNGCNAYHMTSGAGWQYITFNAGAKWHEYNNGVAMEHDTLFCTINEGKGWTRFEIKVGSSDYINLDTVSEGYSETTRKTFTWTSSDNTIATVSENGTVTGVKEGYVTITATKDSTTFTISLYIVAAED